jgi:hypothetical protein
MHTHRRPRPAFDAFLVALVVLGAGVFAYRGPIRAMTEGNYDLALVYSAARAWLIGLNPYSAADVSKAWADANGPAYLDPMLTRGQTVLLYPPATFAVLAPFAALPWPCAAWAWVATSTGMWVATLWATARLGDMRWEMPGAKAFWAAGLAFAPAHTCIAHGQTATLAVGLAATGLMVGSGAARGRVWGGVLLGLGAVIKPQVSGLFAAHQVWRGRWAVAAGALASAIVAAGIGVGLLVWGGHPWWEMWRGNVSGFTSLDDGSPLASNPLRYQLINLHYLLHTFTDDAALVRWMVPAIVGAMGAAYVAADLGRVVRRSDLSALGMAAVASLLVVYHRAYDATSLVFALAWGLGTVFDEGESRRARQLGWAALACLAVFFAPGSSMLQQFALAFNLPESVTGSRLWQSLLLPHAVWALLALGVILILVRSGEARRS